MQRVFFFKFRRTAYTCICVGTRSIAAIQLQTLSDGMRHGAFQRF